MSNPEGSGEKQGKSTGNERKASSIGSEGNASSSGEPRDSERIGLSKESEERLLKDCEERINKLILQFRAASDNGMFSQEEAFKNKGIDPKAQSELIIENIMEARRNLYKRDLVESERSLLTAERHYHDAVYSTSKRWRSSYVYAVSLWVYFMGMIIIIPFTYIVITDPSSRLSGLKGDELVFGLFPLLGLQAVVWGAIGGLFQDIWYLWRHVHNRDYRKTWIIQYLSAPFIGGILGAIVYIIIIAGLLALDTDTSGAPRDFVVMGLAAFAGYNWDWAIRRFETIGAKFQD